LGENLTNRVVQEGKRNGSGVGRGTSGRTKAQQGVQKMKSKSQEGTASTSDEKMQNRMTTVALQRRDAGGVQGAKVEENRW